MHAASKATSLARCDTEVVAALLSTMWAPCAVADWARARPRMEKRTAVLAALNGEEDNRAGPAAAMVRGEGEEEEAAEEH